MIGEAIGKTVRSLIRPSVVLILLLPFIVATAFWVVVLVMFWQSWTGFLTGTSTYQWMLSYTGPGNVAEVVTMFGVILFTILVFAPLWYLTYILIIDLLLFPILLPRIQKQDYPNIEKKRGGNTIGSLANAMKGTAVYIIGFFVNLPVWFFFPVIAPGISLLLTAYLNKKVFTYDVLQDYASAEERENIMKHFSHELWGLGLMTAFLTWIPFVNIFAPAITAVAYIHYCLSRLEHGRKAVAL
jgi:hypothetical protein